MNKALNSIEQFAIVRTRRSMHCRFPYLHPSYLREFKMAWGYFLNKPTDFSWCGRLFFWEVVKTWISERRVIRRLIFVGTKEVVITATARPKSTFVFTKTAPFCVSRKTRMTHRHSLSIAGHYDRVFTFVVGSIQKLDYVEWFILSYESSRDIGEN